MSKRRRSQRKRRKSHRTIKRNTQTMRRRKKMNYLQSVKKEQQLLE
jgi:hypothetical protein